MAAQVIRTSLFIFVAVFTISYAALIATNYEVRYMRETFATWLANYNVTVGNPEKIVTYVDYLEDRQSRASSDIVQDGRMNAVAEQYRSSASLYAFYAAGLGLLTFIISLGVFFWVGQGIGENEHVRGSRLISQDMLKRWSEKKWKSYRKRFGQAAKTDKPYTIAGIPFPPNAVEAQTGIFGTMGVGKTNAIKELLSTIRERNGRAIVYDRMGGLVRDFYDPQTDIIINPFDARSKIWSPFFEAQSPAALAQIAEVMIPQRPGQNDPFWSQTARLVFEYTARSLLKKKTATNADLRRSIMTVSPDELEALVSGTPGQHFFGKAVEKTSASIRANMIAELRFLEYLRDDGDPFSVRDWVKSDKPGFVFLSGDAEHSAVTRNIISTVTEVAANALMTCDERRDPSLWFFLDELPSLNRLPFLISKLAEIRQFGGAFVLGYQVYSQLEDIYGEKGAQSIAGTLNNRVVFNTPDARTAKLFSESLGFEDIVEQRENLSFGAHESRDGVSFMAQRVERPIVSASEIQALPQFQAYIRFAYDAPTAQVSFGPIDIKQKAEKFIPYMGNGFDLDGMNPANVPAPEDAKGSDAARTDPNALAAVKQEQLKQFANWHPSHQIAAFDIWLTEGRKPDFDTDSGRLVAPLDGYSEDLLWDHYFRQRVAGRETPAYHVTPNMSEMMGSRGPSKDREKPPLFSVPPYLATRVIAQELPQKPPEAAWNDEPQAAENSDTAGPALPDTENARLLLKTGDLL
jgi:type IV conjugative transfer system coupling protein TraD